MRGFNIWQMLTKQANCFSSLVTHIAFNVVWSYTPPQPVALRDLQMDPNKKVSTKLKISSISRQFRLK